MSSHNYEPPDAGSPWDPGPPPVDTTPPNGSVGVDRGTGTPGHIDTDNQGHMHFHPDPPPEHDPDNATDGDPPYEQDPDGPGYDPPLEASSGGGGHVEQGKLSWERDANDTV